MARHELTPPVTEAQVRALHVDDTVTLQGVLFGIRDATQIALFDRGRKTRFDLAGHAVIHTAPNVKKVPPSPEHPAGYAPLCVGTTTSARMETTWVEAIEDVDLDELNPESLWRFRIRDFGPLRVAMDSHGGSIYATVDADARGKRAAALAALGVKAR
jgi:L(+)-tartrate dehydratase beta subunit